MTDRSFNEQMTWIEEEIEAHPIHYLLARGKDLLGIYDSVEKLQDAYEKTQEQHKYMTKILGSQAEDIVKQEKVIIQMYDEFLDQWDRIDPNQLFWRENVNKDKCKIIDLVINDPDLCMFKLEKLKRTLTGYSYIYKGELSEHNVEILPTRFNDIEHTYEVFGLFEGYWGNWNFTPSAGAMQKIAKEWYKKYGAELTCISNNTLAFTCKKMSEEEARNLIEEVKSIHAEITDCKPEELVRHLMEKKSFTLWWD